MFNFNFNLKDKKATETLIYLVVRWKGNRLKYSTHEKINPKYWNDNSQRAKLLKDFPNASLLNDRLDQIEATAKNAISKSREITETPLSTEVKDWLDIEFKRVESKVVPTQLNNFIDFFIQERTGEINPKTNSVYSKKTLYKYKEVKDVVNRIESKIRIHQIGMGFYHKFKEYLTKENKSINTIGKYITTLKTILHAARSKGIELNRTYNSKEFVSMSEKSTSIYLNENELKQIFDLDLRTRPKLEKVRDLFLVGAWTGLRFADFTNLRKEDIQSDDIIEIRTTKTQKINEKTAIPLHPIVKIILKKYEYELPKVISNQKFNEYIKEVGFLAGINEPFTKSITLGNKVVSITKEKCQFISSHTARRSFATNLYKQNFPSISIMAITGHTTETSFLKYIKVTKREHAIKIKEHWNKPTKEIKMYG